MMTGERRTDAGIDANEEHAHLRSDAVTQQRKVGHESAADEEPSI
jgi:hypothetical protein